jgi:ABC-type multidrug transport system fused ATPase/permease subunit
MKQNIFSYVFSFRSFIFMFRIIRHFWPEIVAHKWWLFGCIITMVGIAFTNAIFPFILKDFANVLSLDPDMISFESMNIVLFRLSIFYFCIWLLWRFFDVMIVFFESRGMRDLEVRCFQAMQSQSMRFF